MVRAGYAWVGVSAQQFGVNALKTFSTARYATTNPAGAGKVVNAQNAARNPPEEHCLEERPPCNRYNPNIASIYDLHEAL
jgi:hypothetical protein